MFAQIAGAAVAKGEARLTRVIKDVQLVRGSARAAAPNDRVGDGSVRAGADSRAELVLPGNTLLRMGANSVVTLSEGAKRAELGEGALLFQAPKPNAGVKLRTGALTIEIGGATGMVERYANYVKVLLLQGTARVFLQSKLGESVLVDAGQILITRPDAKTLPEPVDFEIAQLYRTSVLTNRDFRPLPSDPLIQAEIEKQKKNPALIPTNLVIRGRGTLVTLADPATVETRAQQRGGSPSPSPTPSRSPARPRR
ncbi:MAG TPA: FecR domain-containing protein [Chthoniobacterales bacterium]